MAGYQIKRTVGEHYEETSFSSAEEAITYLRSYVKPEQEAKLKAKENEKVEEKKEEKAKQKKTKKEEK